MNGLSKRLVSLTMATAMVFSLTAVPATEASAATKTITAKTTSVQAGQTYTYSINAKKAKNVKISVSGAAKSGVTATVNGKKLSGKTLKGGKTLKVTIKANTKVVGKKFVVNYKLDKKATKKTKAIKVNYSAKSVSLDQTALTLEAGKTATLKATINPTTSNSTIKSWVSSDEKVATVNNGVVTAVAAGTADITVTTSNGKTAKATVTVEEKKEEVKDTVPQMTALTATAADTLKATFASAVPADAAISVERKGSTAGITGIATWNDDRTELTYKLTTNMVADVYTMTVKVGESSTSLTYEATARKATSIEILGDTALTNDKKDEAYVYYDVKDQYGDSVRSSTSVNITTNADSTKADRSSGKITMKDKEFKYGDIISVTIVDNKNGLSQSKVVTVGLEQKLDKVVVAGFVNVDESKTILTQLPENFAAGKYVVLYQALDQQGNLMDNTTDNLDGEKKKFTVTVSDPMIIDSEFKDSGKNFTIDGITYDSFKIEPGDYSDRGGDVVLQFISNSTGTKSSYSFKVSSAGILDSLSLDLPAETVADTEGTSLTYKAFDTNGNEITNYETIVRSTNKLNLNASVGTLTISEGNDGEALIYWLDSQANERDWDDGIDQQVVLTTIVVGGKTDYCQFGVADYAYPVAFKEIHTSRWTDTILFGGKEIVRFTENNNEVVCVDQYGREKSGKWVADRIKTINNDTDHKFTSYLAVVCDTAGMNGTVGAGKFGLDEKYYMAPSTIDILPSGKASGDQDKLADGSESIKFFIGATDDRKAPTDDKGNKRAWKFEDFNAVGSQKTVTYTAVKYADVKNIVIEDVNTMPIKTNLSDYANLYAAEKANKKTLDTIENGNWRSIKVVGKANNEKVYVPSVYWQLENYKENVFKVDPNTDSNYGMWGYTITVSGNLALGDLYNTASTTGERKTATKTLKLKIATVSGNELVKDDIIEKEIKISDEKPIATTIKFFDGKWNALTDKAIVDPNYMGIKISDNLVDNGKKSNVYFGQMGIKDTIIFQIFDQYGDQMTYTNSKAKVTISDLVENTAALAHVTNSLGTLSNNTALSEVTGAEIKDTFKFTVKAGNATGTLLVTVGGDSAAKMDDDANKDQDEDFRIEYLNYKSNK